MQELLTVKEVAVMLSLSVRSIWRMDAEGRIPKSMKIGKSRRWNAKALTQWIQNGCPRMGGEA